MQYPNGCIMVFCKAPEPGQVKTRLGKTIGDDAAATIHKYLAWHCLEKLVGAHIAPIEMWCSPDTEHDFFQRCGAAFGVVLKTQKGKCLGQRMENAFSEARSRYQSAVVIGTDCPAINPAYLKSAFSSLVHHDSVVGPAEDGGYVLLGLRKAQPEIFVDMPWGTSKVLDETLSRLKGNVEKIETQWDVDNAEDLMRLRTAANKLQLGKEFSKYLEGLEW